MSLIRQTLRPNTTRLWLAVMLVCALLVTQFGLTRHAVEHTTAPVIASMTADQDTGTPEQAGCLTCLEYQAHGSGLISQAVIMATDSVRSFEQSALSPNTPYLTPERASQRAPPVLS